jgi:hypothetical protein
MQLTTQQITQLPQDDQVRRLTEQAQLKTAFALQLTLDNMEIHCKGMIAATQQFAEQTQHAIVEGLHLRPPVISLDLLKVLDEGKIRELLPQLQRDLRKELSKVLEGFVDVQSTDGILSLNFNLHAEQTLALKNEGAWGKTFGFSPEARSPKNTLEPEVSPEFEGLDLSFEEPSQALVSLFSETRDLDPEAQLEAVNGKLNQAGIYLDPDVLNSLQESFNEANKPGRHAMSRTELMAEADAAMKAAVVKEKPKDIPSYFDQPDMPKPKAYIPPPQYNTPEWQPTPPKPRR